MVAHLPVPDSVSDERRSEAGKAPSDFAAIPEREHVHYDITTEPLELEALVGAVRSDAMGGLVTFVGFVRERSDDDRLVTGLSYEAHRELALAEMRTIGAEASVKFGTARVAIAHRIGALALGEAAVAIAVASMHRATAFDACEYAIDELKKRVPIWKKEHYRDGDESWRENVVPDS